MENGRLSRVDPHQHIPVLCHAVLETLRPQPGETVVDVTVGLGGHARFLAEAVGETGRLVGLDVDPGNLSIAEERLADVACPIELVRSNFAALPAVLESVGVEGADVLLADLGVSSTQLDDVSRGFSFRHDGELDMRMDDRLTDTAGDLVNRLRENELSDLIYYHSQERLSRRIAKRICQVRRDGRIKTTGELSDIVCSAMGIDPRSRKSKIHPATRTFQALRIAVNDELSCLGTLLSLACGCLSAGGRIGVIAFHSLEDSMVKKDFRERKANGEYEILTKRPVIADEEERCSNPRSRSAKFRAARRLGPGVGEALK